MKYNAKCMFARISPTKLHAVAVNLRNCSVSEGLMQLRFLHNRGARFLESLVLSAKANAEDLGVRDGASLRISSLTIGSGPTLKRIQPHVRGVGFMIKKRTSPIYIE